MQMYKWGQRTLTPFIRKHYSFRQRINTTLRPRILNGRVLPRTPGLIVLPAKPSTAFAYQLRTVSEEGWVKMIVWCCIWCISKLFHGNIILSVTYVHLLLYAKTDGQTKMVQKAHVWFRTFRFPTNPGKYCFLILQFVLVSTPKKPVQASRWTFIRASIGGVILLYRWMFRFLVFESLLTREPQKVLYNWLDLWPNFQGRTAIVDKWNAWVYQHGGAMVNFLHLDD